MKTLQTISTKQYPVSPENAPFWRPTPDPAKASELRINDTQEVLNFLAIRPVHTVVMTSFIIDNGIESDLNRGKFYGYRNAEGHLEGVALIGHTTLVEARNDEALRALAVVARKSETRLHLIMSCGTDAERFWQYLSGGATRPRLTCTEALFETAFPFLVPQSDWKIEHAEMSDLMPVADAQAEVAFTESGVDPMITDRDGFLQRVARRIERKRVFVVRENGKIVFKADVIAETDSVIYLEGVYTAPDRRGQGFGSECLSSLLLELFGRAEHVCLLSNVDFKAAHKCFENAGLRNTGQCTTVFV
jgi:uncharacterized protein